MQWLKIALFGGLFFLQACGSSDIETLESNLLSGEYDKSLEIAEKWGKDSKQPDVPAFALSLSAYLAGDLTALNRFRPISIEDTDRKTLGDWISNLKNNPAWPPEPKVEILLDGLAAQVAGDKEKAEQIFKDAIDNTDDPELFRFYQMNLAALRPGNYVLAFVPREEAISYSGPMRMAGQTWVPLDKKFSIGSGTITTTPQQIHPATVEKERLLEENATFSDWAYVRRKSDNEIVSWAALATKGTVYLASEGANLDDAKLLEFTKIGDIDPKQVKDYWHLTVKSKYSPKPADYFGRFMRIELEEGEYFPVSTIPYRATNSGRMSAMGSEFLIKGEHFSGSNSGMTFFGGEGMINDISSGMLFGPVHHVVKF